MPLLVAAEFNHLKDHELHVLDYLYQSYLAFRTKMALDVIKRKGQG